MSTGARRLFAATYDAVTRPLEREVLGPYRQQLLGTLTGRVLDLGAGTGANLPYLTAATAIVAVEPDAAMRDRLATKLNRAAVPVDVSSAAAERLPFPSRSFDAVVATCVLCTVADPLQSLTEARRVLRPGGELVLLEHVRGSGWLARWQDAVTPLWRLVAGGCHPNRDTLARVREAGFRLGPVEWIDPFPRAVPSRPMIAATATVDAPETAIR